MCSIIHPQLISKQIIYQERVEMGKFVCVLLVLFMMMPIFVSARGQGLPQQTTPLPGVGIGLPTLPAAGGGLPTLTHQTTPLSGVRVGVGMPTLPTSGSDLQDFSAAGPDCLGSLKYLSNCLTPTNMSQWVDKQIDHCCAALSKFLDGCLTSALIPFHNFGLDIPSDFKTYCPTIVTFLIQETQPHLDNNVTSPTPPLAPVAATPVQSEAPPPPNPVGGECDQDLSEVDSCIIPAFYSANQISNTVLNCCRAASHLTQVCYDKVLEPYNSKFDPEFSKAFKAFCATKVQPTQPIPVPLIW